MSNQRGYVSPARGEPGKFVAYVLLANGEPAAVLPVGRKNCLCDTQDEAAAALDDHLQRAKAAAEADERKARQATDDRRKRRGLYERVTESDRAKAEQAIHKTGGNDG